jgi:hypothetical protein
MDSIDAEMRELRDEFNVDEHDDIRKHLDELQEEIDAIYGMVIKLTGALNTLLPVPIALDETI